MEWLRTTFLFTDTWGEPSQEGWLPGSVGRGGQRSTMCVFVETRTQNKRQQCGMFVQPGGDWPQGEFSLLLVTGGHLVHWRYHYLFLIHSAYFLNGQRFKKLCLETRNNVKKLMVQIDFLKELFLGWRTFFPTEIINASVNTPSFKRYYCQLDFVYKSVCLNTKWYTQGWEHVLLCVSLRVQYSVFVHQHMVQ